MWLRRAMMAAAIVTCGLTSVSATAAGKVYRIVIDRAAFAEAPAVRVGDTIEWVNKDIVDHTSTASNAAWDVKIPPGKKVRVVMKKAGTIPYFCRFHPTMTGQVVVKPAGAK